MCSSDLPNQREAQVRTSTDGYRRTNRSVGLLPVDNAEVLVVINCNWVRYGGKTRGKLAHGRGMHATWLGTLSGGPRSVERLNLNLTGGMALIKMSTTIWSLFRVVD